MSGTALSTLLKVSLLSIIYLAFWTGLCLWIAGARHTGARNLTVLTGLWLLVCAVLPALVTEMTTRAISVPEGGDIILTQREAVNDAWDLPREDTYAPFFERHPDFSAFTQPTTGFEWKWYYAFQQVGDQTAEPLSQAYTDGRKKRNALARRMSLISPAGFVQAALEGWAETDGQAALDYETEIRAFHRDLRMYYYPRLFDGRAFDAGEVTTRPVFSERIKN